VPTSVDFMRSDPDHMVVSYSTSKAFIFDMENSKPVVTLDCPSTTGINLIQGCSLYTANRLKQNIVCVQLSTSCKYLPRAGYC
jgi:hypothetical protein